MERRRLWAICLLILAVGLERFAWLSFRSIAADGTAIDHFAAAHTTAFRLGIILLVFAIPVAGIAIALTLRSSVRAAVVAGLLTTVPELMIVIALQSFRLRDGYRFFWYRLMDFETIAHYPSMLVASAWSGRFSLAPTDHWLSQIGLAVWRPIELYFAIGCSSLFWFVLFSMLAHKPKHRRRLRRFTKEALSTPAVKKGD